VLAVMHHSPIDMVGYRRGGLMKRREFIRLVGGGTVAWPLVARGQEPTPTVIGFLNGQSADGYRRNIAAFRKALAENGYVEGQNLLIEYRWADGREDRLPELAADLVRRGVALMDCAGSSTATLAAKAATTTIPIVFSTGIDPVKAGYVTSLNRPGGNVTGVTFLASELSAKRLGLLRQLLPNLAILATLSNPKHPANAADVSEAANLARSMGVKVHVLSASNETEIAAAFATLDGVKVDALLVGGDPVFFDSRRRVVALAAQHAIPAAYELRDFADEGGLLSYGPSIVEAYYQAGIYAARILKGEKPGDLPVMQSVKFEFVINLRTAKTLGITVPPTMLATVDEVIE
jgi:putative tryptophan/tyrosine transport system substrate-binding protein